MPDNKNSFLEGVESYFKQGLALPSAVRELNRETKRQLEEAAKPTLNQHKLREQKKKKLKLKPKPDPDARKPKPDALGRSMARGFGQLMGAVPQALGFEPDPAAAPAKPAPSKAPPAAPVDMPLSSAHRGDTYDPDFGKKYPDTLASMERKSLGLAPEDQDHPFIEGLAPDEKLTGSYWRDARTDPLSPYNESPYGDGGELDPRDPTSFGWDDALAPQRATPQPPAEEFDTPWAKRKRDMAARAMLRKQLRAQELEQQGRNAGR